MPSTCHSNQVVVSLSLTIQNDDTISIMVDSSLAHCYDPSPGRVATLSTRLLGMYWRCNLCIVNGSLLSGISKFDYRWLAVGFRPQYSLLPGNSCLAQITVSLKFY